MGLFGGGNSSSSSTAQEGGFSNIGGPVLQLNNSGSNTKTNVTFTDNGAVQAALASNQSIAGEALNAVQAAGADQTNTLSQAIGAIQQASQGQAESIAMTAVKWGAVVLLAYFAMRAFSKGAG